MMARLTIMPSVLLSLIGTVSAAFTPYGYQSGKDIGSSFAGGMVYDKQNHLLFVTGQTYGEFFLGNDIGLVPNPIASNCFLGIAKLPSETNTRFEWLYTREMGNASVAEACTSLIHYPAPQNKLYAIGHSEEGGTVTRIRPAGSSKSKVYGVMADFDVMVSGSGDDQTASLKLNGGRLLHPEPGAHYPMAVSSEWDRRGFYMAAMSARNSYPSLQELPESQSRPDLTKGGWRKYGRGYELILQYLSPLETPITSDKVDLNETLKGERILTTGATDSDGKIVDVHITSVQTMSPTSLLIAGSTSGFGNAFEEKGSENGDTDGFVTKVNPSIRKVEKAVRIGSGEDDYINAICHHEDSVFVVGTTYGMLRQEDRESIGAEAFIVKLDAETMDIIWIRQFAAVAGPNSFEDPEYEEEYDAHAIACAVTPDGDTVYVAGNVDEGALLVENEDDDPKTSSLGGDDIFLIQLTAKNGEVNYIVQEGTSKHDRMAHGGGLVVDNDGNAIVMGSTNGAFIRNKDVDDEHFTDVFFLVFDKSTGQHQTSIEREKAMNGGIIPPKGNPPPAEFVDPGDDDYDDDDDDDNSQFYDDDDDDDAGDAPENLEKSGEGGGGVSGFVIFLCLLVGLAVVVCGTFMALRSRKEIHRKLQNSPTVDPVSPYLVNFNYGDVDMKHSATGGYHGVYTDPKFSQGVDTSPKARTQTTELEEIKFDVGATGGGAISSSTFNSSIVMNSLFMDDLDEPQLGSTAPGDTRRLATMNEDDEAEANHSASQRQLSTYDDLLDAYNTTWDDLNPHKLPSSGLSASGSSRKKESESLLSNDNDPWGQEII